MLLSDLQPGQSCIITQILGHGAFRKRVMEMGFVRGRELKVLLHAPLQDPVKYAIMGYEVSLRRSEARMIEVIPLRHVNDASHNEVHSHQTDEHDSEREFPARVAGEKVINVALIGNPNCGKTSLFNNVSGAHEHVGNYAGVTVAAKEGSMKYKGYRLNIVDLPGTYSLSAYSPEELYVMRYLKEETPDVLVNVVVASNLERNLYLTTELIDMNRDMVIALNMYDELENSDTELDHELLGGMLGVPVVPTSAKAGKGITALLDAVIDVYEMRRPEVRHIHVKMRPEIEQAIRPLIDAIKEDANIDHRFSPRFLAIKFLERDPEIEKTLKSQTPDYSKLETIRSSEDVRVKKLTGEDINSAVASEKYGFIQGALAETLREGKQKESKTTKIIDAFVTNKLFGFPIFIGVMLLMFWCTFTLGEYPMGWIEDLVSWISGLIGNYMSDGPLKDLLLDGIIGGVGGVIVFLPNILILYAFISFMEDSGYMARVAFIMDKLMHRMGLHGKSFIPLVMGFGCNVPAIMGTRIIESRSSRLITILVNPFISCSARIPIYVLLASAFFPGHGTWVMFGLYFIGIIVAIVTAKMLRKFWFKADETPFVMELPPYRVPTAKAVARNMWAKARQYLQKMSGIILVASIIIWALSYYPQVDSQDVPSEFKTEALAEMPSEFKADKSADQLEDAVTSEYQQCNSMLGQVGRFCEPLVRPLDFDWKITVSLLAGAAAKEVIVSTLGVLYVGEDDATVLGDRLKASSPTTGQPPFTPLKALTFMLFVLIYFPCIATITAIVRETGSLKYGIFSVVYNTGLAWLVSFLFYQGAIIFGF